MMVSIITQVARQRLLRSLGVRFKMGAVAQRRPTEVVRQASLCLAWAHFLFALQPGLF